MKALTPDDHVVLTLCDGLGDAALSLSLKKVGWNDFEFTRDIAVEKSKTQRNTCDAANPATWIFPGVERGLHQKHNITTLTEADIRGIPAATLKLFTGDVRWCDLRVLAG